MVRTLGSKYEDPGLSESNLASTYNKASWRAQAVIRVHEMCIVNISTYDHEMRQLVK